MIDEKKLEDGLDEIEQNFIDRGFIFAADDSRNGRKELGLTNKLDYRFDNAAKRLFLLRFAQSGRIMYSARCAGVSRYTVFRHRQEDSAIKEAFEEAKAVYRDQLEAEMHRRGVDGYDEEV